jgi:hypothetical protein
LIDAGSAAAQALPNGHASSMIEATPIDQSIDP